MATLLSDMKADDEGTSLLDELRDTPDTSGQNLYSEPWQPEEGDSIEGVVIETFSFQSGYKDSDTGEKPTIPGLVIVLDDENEPPWSVVGLHSVLRREIEDNEIQVGDRVAIIYEGERESRKDPDNSFHYYRLGIRQGSTKTQRWAKRVREEILTEQADMEEDELPGAAARAEREAAAGKASRNGKAATNGKAPARRGRAAAKEADEEDKPARTRGARTTKAAPASSRRAASAKAQGPAEDDEDEEETPPARGRARASRTAAKPARGRSRSTQHVPVDDDDEDPDF